MQPAQSSAQICTSTPMKSEFPWCVEGERQLGDGCAVKAWGQSLVVDQHGSGGDNF